MAANPDIVEDEIDQSTDERPASRRKVMGAVTAKGTSPSRSPQRKPLIADFLAATIDLDKRVDRIVRLTQDDRFRSNADRIADSYLSHFVRDRDALSDVITYFIETRGSNTP
jgi:hypothetical protein